VPYRQPGNQQGGSALSNKKLCLIPLSDLGLAAVNPAPINLNLQDCRFEGRFDPSFRRPANLADS
jgi:hypothetical protein